MSRRRAAREQEKQEFLQQHPELIDFNIRVEVEAQSVEPDNQDDVEEGQLFGVSVESAFFSGLTAELSQPMQTGAFALVENVAVEQSIGIAAWENFTPSVLPDGSLNPAVEKPEQAALTLSTSGFGVASSEELIGADPQDGTIPPGADTLGAGEALILQASGVDGFGIDFTASGQGSIVFQFFEALSDGTQPSIAEFQIPAGASADEIFNFEPDTTSDFIFGATIYTTGSAEVSIIGVDLIIDGTEILAVA